MNKPLFPFNDFCRLNAISHQEWKNRSVKTLSAFC